MNPSKIAEISGNDRSRMPATTSAENLPQPQIHRNVPSMSTVEILEELPKLDRQDRYKLLERLEELQCEDFEETPEMLAAIEAGRRSLREGKRHTVEEARALIRQWTTKST
jgi:hypothetical protein